MTQLTLLTECAVCASPDCHRNTHALNGLPLGVDICQDCTQAVRRRQVGISRWTDGSLSVTDGRSLVDERQAVIA